MRVILVSLAFAFPSLSVASEYISQPVTASQLSISALQINPITETFTPKPRRKTKLDYTVWDEFLTKTVLPTGASTRQFAKGLREQTGTRIPSGHESKLKLEGNKIILSRFTKAHKKWISDYRYGLESMATEQDITTFEKSEQLAFWINLHNAALIETLALNYPLRKPSEFMVPEHNALLHDAKIITIRNTPLSLRDIREKIVYAHWTDPKVFYGFGLGDIASPTLQNQAYTSGNVETLLSEGAREFTNSLRGYRSGKVSKLYNDISKFYFKDFEKDLAAHFNTYMRDDVKAELAEYGIQGTSKYEKHIADLTGGTGARVSSLNLTSYQVSGGRLGRVSVGGETSDSNAVASNITESGLRQMHGAIGSFAVALSDKTRTLEKMGLSDNGTVIIEDFETPSED